MWRRLEKKLAGSSNEVVIKVQDEKDRVEIYN